MPTIAGIGEVMQLGFVPRDWDAALKYWIETMGAGPFHVLSGNHAETAYHRGRPSDPELTIAFGHWGDTDLQIELIRQDNDAPSIYREWLDEGREGVQHVCVVTDDLDRAHETIEASGAQVVCGGAAVGTTWFYADTGGGPGTMVEVTCQSEQVAAMMKMIRDSARGWDGSDPIRHL